MKKILLIGTGGTIASKKSESGLTPQLSSDELLEFVPDAKNYAYIDSLQLIDLDSTNIQPKHWIMIAGCIEEHYEAYDGFVICHGTDTMAYTAAALSYLIQNSKKPIVVTGAQKPIDLDVTDAKTNLIDSILFSVSDDAHGIHIVFDGKVILGSRARKERTKSYNAFSSINYPYTAIVQDGRVIFYLTDKYDDADTVHFYHNLDTKVGLIKLIPAMDSSILQYMSEHYDAIIIESYGVGGLPTYESSDYHGAIADLISHGKIVVMTTQVPLEGSHMSVYEVGRNIKKEFGLIESYDMTLESTVTKLMWILAQTHELSKVSKLFHTNIAGDTLW